MNDIGNRIKQARVAAGLTQKDLADRAGVTYQAVSNYEQGRREPSFEVMESIADALGCNMADLLSSDKEESMYREARTRELDDEPELWALREALRTNVGMRMLLREAKNYSDKELRMFARMLKAGKGGDNA